MPSFCICVKRSYILSLRFCSLQSVQVSQSRPSCPEDKDAVSPIYSPAARTELLFAMFSHATRRYRASKLPGVFLFLRYLEIHISARIMYRYIDPRWIRFTENKRWACGSSTLQKTPQAQIPNPSWNSYCANLIHHEREVLWFLGISDALKYYIFNQHIQPTYMVWNTIYSTNIQISAWAFWLSAVTNTQFSSFSQVWWKQICSVGTMWYGNLFFLWIKNV